MTTPFPFVAGQILTAAQLNDIQNLPISDKTASYTLVVGDVTKRTIMNAAGATTITVNDAIFTVGDVIQVANKGAGVCTITAGAGVTINTSGSLALAQYESGQLVALSASSFLFLAFSGTTGEGTAYTPSFVNFTLGNGTVAARYIQIGEFVFVYGHVILGSTSSVTGQIRVSLPVTSVSMTRQQQWATCTDTGTANYSASTIWIDTTTMAINALNAAGTYLAGVTTNATTPFTWTNLDEFAFALMYEAA
jgi:hypothetical protein